MFGEERPGNVPHAGLQVFTYSGYDLCSCTTLVITDIQTDLRRQIAFGQSYLAYWLVKHIDLHLAAAAKVIGITRCRCLTTVHTKYLYYVTGAND